MIYKPPEIISEIASKDLESFIAEDLVAEAWCDWCDCSWVEWFDWHDTYT